jgi:PAS domain-containing protein
MRWWPDALLALVLGLLVSYRLILSARDADARYRHLFATASDAVVIADQETGVILDANPKLAELTGTPIAKLLGTNQSALFGREIPAVPGSSPLQAGDLVIRHVSGSSIPVDVRHNVADLANASWTIVLSATIAIDGAWKSTYRKPLGWSQWAVWREGSLTISIIC